MGLIHGLEAITNQTSKDYYSLHQFGGDIGVARIFDLGGGRTTNHMQWRHQKLSEEVLFVGKKYRRKEDQKPGLALNHVIVFNQEFA